MKMAKKITKKNFVLLYRIALVGLLGSLILASEGYAGDDTLATPSAVGRKTVVAESHPSDDLNMVVVNRDRRAKNMVPALPQNLLPSDAMGEEDRSASYVPTKPLTDLASVRPQGANFSGRPQ